MGRLLQFPLYLGGGELQFFGIGPLELLMILVVALIVLGPQRLPEAAIYIAQP